MAIGKMVSLTGLEKRFYQMELHLMEDGSKGKQEVTVLRLYQMELFSKVNGRRVDSFLVSASSQTDRSMMVNGTKENQKVSV